MWLAQRKRRFLKAPWLLTVPQSFTSLSTSPPPRSLHFYLTARMWLAVESALLPLTASIISQIARSKMLYLCAAEFIGFCRNIMDLFTSNLLRASTNGGKVFNIPKKRRGKKFTRRTFSNPLNACPVFFSRVEKYSLQLDYTGHRSVTFLRIFLLCCGEHTNFSIQFLCMLFDPITFGFVIIDITAKTTCTP